MKRYHSRGDQKARRKHRKAYEKFIGVYPRNYDIGEGRRDNWNKRHPLDCGKTACYVCHGSKLLDDPTHHEVKARVDFKEQVKDAISSAA